MKNKNILFTSESVSEGHPDKVCDQISDAILDACLTIDSNAKVGCEVMATYKKIIISGEVKLNGEVNFEKIARQVLLNIGYNHPETSLDGNTFPIEVIMNQQSPEISNLVNKKELGAGDQGLMFGYATNATSNMMPLPITITNDIMKLATNLRKNGKFKWAYPDMKAQITLDITNKTKPILKNVVMAIQCANNHFEDVKVFAAKNIIKPVIEKYNLSLKDAKIIINTFNVGGPKADVGLTGRKIIVDTYGGWSRHGGGAFSGKDGSKVDRSGSYMARYVAKNIVQAGLTDECEIQLSYVIGQANPTSLFIDCFGTEKININKILKIINKVFDFRPSQIIETLSLDQPIFSKTSAYGHFGNVLTLPWEKTNKVKEIKEELKKLDI